MIMVGKNEGKVNAT